MQYKKKIYKIIITTKDQKRIVAKYGLFEKEKEAQKKADEIIQRNDFFWCNIVVQKYTCYKNQVII